MSETLSSIYFPTPSIIITHNPILLLLNPHPSFSPAPPLLQRPPPRTTTCTTTQPRLWTPTRIRRPSGRDLVPLVVDSWALRVRLCQWQQHRLRLERAKVGSSMGRPQIWQLMQFCQRQGRDKVPRSRVCGSLQERSFQRSLFIKNFRYLIRGARNSFLAKFRRRIELLSGTCIMYQSSVRRFIRIC